MGVKMQQATYNSLIITDKFENALIYEDFREGQE